MPVANSTKPASMASNVPQWSRWSGSTLVTIPTSAGSSRNDPSDSSASTTNRSPAPWWALAPESLSSLPIANEGSAPQCCGGDGEHRGRGRLAVRSGHGDAPGPGHHRGQGLSAGHDRDALLPGRHDLGVGRPDGRRDDHDVGTPDVGRVMADPRVDAQRAQRNQPTGLLGIAAGDDRTAGHEDARDARTCPHRRCRRCARGRSGPPSPLTPPCGRQVGRPPR